MFFFLFSQYSQSFNIYSSLIIPDGMRLENIHSIIDTFLEENGYQITTGELVGNVEANFLYDCRVSCLAKSGIAGRRL